MEERKKMSIRKRGYLKKNKCQSEPVDVIMSFN